ncbi:hypothetical protein Tco_1532351 [Tanacetum coccineum]
MKVYFNMTVRQKAECLCTPRAQDFLLAIPVDWLGQHMSPVKYRTIIKYRLMIPLFPVDEICPVCRKVCLNSFREHAVHSKELSGFKYRHDMVRDVLFDAALKVVSCKVTKHEKACIENQHVFVPFAFDAFGFLAPEAVELLNRFQRVMHEGFDNDKEVAGCAWCRRSGFPAFAQQSMDILPTREVIDHMLNCKKSAFASASAYAFAPSEMFKSRI